MELLVVLVTRGTSRPVVRTSRELGNRYSPPRTGYQAPRATYASRR